MSEHVDDLLARRAELTYAEDARLQEHLLGCAHCRETAAAYARQRELLRAMPMAVPPPALRARVLADIQAPPRRRWVFPRLLALGPVAAALLVVVALAALHRSPSSSPQRDAGKATNATVAHSTPTTAAQRATSRPSHHKQRSIHRKGKESSTPPSNGTRYGPPQGPVAPPQTGPVVAQAYPTAAPGVPPVYAVTAPTPAVGARRPALSAAPHPSATSPVSIASGPTTGPPLTGGGSAPTRPPQPAHPPTQPPPTSEPQSTVVVLAPVTPPPTSTPVPPVPVLVAPSPAPTPLPTP